MAKRVIWSLRAKEERREILEYWAKRNGDKIYSRKLSKAFREKIEFIARKRQKAFAVDFNFKVASFYINGHVNREQLVFIITGAVSIPKFSCLFRV